MKRIKRYFVVLLTVIMMLSLNGLTVFAAEMEEADENYVEISLDQAQPYADGYYSKGLVVLNIATSGVSNKCTVTSGSVPSGAVITKVEVRGTKSAGSGTVYWYVKHNASGYTASKFFANPATFNDFNGLTADSSWTVWIEGDAWSTVRNGSIKVYYR